MPTTTTQSTPIQTTLVQVTPIQSTPFKAKGTATKFRALAFVTLCLPLFVGCNAMRVKKELHWYKQERERLLQDLNRIEHDLNICRGEQEGLKDKLVDAARRARLAEESMIQIAPAAAPVAEPEPTVVDPSAFAGIDDVDVEQGAGGEIRLTLNQSILFPAGSAVLSKSGAATLRQLSEVLARDYADNSVRVEGHTDNTPVKKAIKKYPSNWELSTARASSVVRALLRAKAVAASQVTVSGYADQRPVSTNGTAEGRKSNRRVEIWILP
ncbi:MAG: OmpA family protein [Planctomycetota bacterium]